ncbi:hypothetical protein M406DRAFT_58174 [Cryphonectria parasitica EP155]|uniref:Uncharacterized protein n=1 Tax=Cryphonectria parasitica (strain ATCC 38755 / EP155) TaxID=660469 RepID=A0A9P4Y0J3_CRYP1|nr:uncharacterized protein M406DRAFT_58174 [Cryphonectria parasitica EP155]KAF3763920.1 hypothetical protein M406DRAFT_58174 [Cryphonectria parasitica EP155]
MISIFSPWSTSSDSMQAFIDMSLDDPLVGSWRDNKITELSTVNVTAALVAAVASAALSWQAIDSAAWTVLALFYASLIMSLTAVTIGAQQSIALSRLGGHRVGLGNLQKKLRGKVVKQATQTLNVNKHSASYSQLYLWQLPVMLLNASILIFLIGLSIIIWSQAASHEYSGDTMKIAIVTSLTGIFGIGSYIFAAVCLYA